MKSLSFRWQLILFILLTCGVTLALAFAGFYLYDSQQFNAEVESRLAKTRSLMLDNLGPLLDQNPHATDIQLNLLGVDAQIAAAAVYSSDGKILTRYVRAGQTEVIPPLPRVSKLLDVSRGVVWEPILGPTNRPLGTLYLKAEQSEADRDRLSNLLRGSAIVFVVAALLAGAMAWRFQGRITEPITELARVSTTVQRERNYNERVQTTASGEIGELIDSFNAMLDTIQSNTSELERARVAAEDAHEKIIQAHDQLEEANRTLEARVDDRTRLLAKAVKDAEEASKAKASATTAPTRTTTRASRIQRVRRHIARHPIGGFGRRRGTCRNRGRAGRGSEKGFGDAVARAARVPRPQPGQRRPPACTRARFVWTELL